MLIYFLVLANVILKMFIYLLDNLIDDLHLINFVYLLIIMMYLYTLYLSFHLFILNLVYTVILSFLVFSVYFVSLHRDFIHNFDYYSSSSYCYYSLADLDSYFVKLLV
jgi:hypothetical protein